MTDEQYGNIMKALGRNEERLKAGDEKFTTIQLNQLAISAKLDKSNGGLKRHLDRHKMGGKIIKWGSALSAIATAWWRWMN